MKRYTFGAAASERGNILVMAAMLLVGIFGILALAIDSAELSATSRQKTETANAMALAALNAYVSAVDARGAPISFEMPISDEEQQARFSAAVNRAITVARANLMTARFRESHVVGGTVDIVGGLNGADADRDGVRGRIETGRWYSRKPEVCTRYSGCPCNLPDGQETRGCFLKCSNDWGCRSHDTNDQNPYPANAVRVTLWTAEGEGVMNNFARLLGVPETAVQGQGAAAIIPRRVVVMPSLSRSETVESHLPAERGDGTMKPAEYAFICQNGCQARQLATATPASCDGFSFRPYQFDLTDHSVSKPDPKAAWDSLPGQHAPGAIAPTAHAKMDYECVQFPYGGDPSSPTMVSALVDFRDYEGATRSAPQPFTKILGATGQTLLSISQSAGGGDRVSLLGYGQTLQRVPWPVVSTEPEYRAGRRWRFASPREQDADFRAMRTLTEESVAGRQARLRNGFLPLGNEPYSDLPRALDAARQLLTEDGFASLSQNYVVVVTSGLTTCWSESEPDKPRCALSYSANLKSLQETVLRSLGATDSPSFLRSQITVFPILVGDNLAPHRLLYRRNSAPNICMSSTEMIEARCQSTVGLLAPGNNAIDHGLSAAAYRLIGARPTPVSYFTPGYFLAIGASATGGQLIPLLVKTGCPRVGDALCQAIGAGGKTRFEELIDGACQAYTGAPSGQLACADRNRSWMWRVIDGRNGGLRPNWQDETGRMFCDPQCRTAQQQVDGVFDELFRAPTLRLIESGPQ